MWTSQKRASRSKSKGRGNRKHMPPQPPLLPPPGGYRILVLVGIPGSGKSTFASFLEDMGWTVVNQDALGSREKCRRKAQQILQSGGRVVVDRCNFDQSQRSTWINLAVFLSLHEDACIALWLDVAIGICQGRVQGRVGHPTLGPGPSSAGIIKRMTADLRPPHRKEGFHTVLRCKDDQDLSDAVALLSFGGGGGASGAASGGAGHHSARGDDDHTSSRAPSPSTILDTAGSGVNGLWDGGAAEAVKAVWDQQLPPQGSAVAMPWVQQFPQGIAANAGAAPPPAERSSKSSLSGDVWASAAGAGLTSSGALAPGQGLDFPVGTGSGAAASVSSSTPDRVGSDGPIVAWGGGGVEGRAGRPQQVVHVHGTGRPILQAREEVLSIRQMDMDAASNFPSLPSGSSSEVGASSKRCSSKTNKRSPQRPPPPPPPPPPPGAYQSSSLSSIAKLTPQARAAAASSSAAGVQSPPKSEKKLLTPSEISAKFSDFQAPPRVIAPEDVGVAAAPFPSHMNHCRSGSAAVTTTRNDSLAPPALPLGPSTLAEWTSRSTSRSTASTYRDGLENADQSGKTATPAARGVPHDGCEGSAAAVVGDENYVGCVDTTTASGGEGELDVSEGEAFFVLEDMFGGLLPPKTLENVFLESTNNLEKAVDNAFQICSELWGQEEEPASPLSSDAMTATHDDDVLAPSTKSSATDTSSKETYSETTWDGDSDGEFADVSEWTDKQMETLTEFCLAFEGTVSRESIVAALTASSHDAAVAAQLLLEPVPETRLQGTVGCRKIGGCGNGRSKGKHAPCRESSGKLAAPTLLGASCDRSSAVAGRWQQSAEGVCREGGEEEDEAEEEEGDEGLTSEEYRARAHDAATEMKAWFQKAAEAFTRGGRNGGAAAADPSMIGQRWKKKMEAANLRAAREAFRERNPLIKVGHPDDDEGATVLKVLALPRPSQCSTRGQLAVDLHMLRRAEALSVLETVLRAVTRKPRGVRRKRPPAPTSTLHNREDSDHSYVVSRRGSTPEEQLGHPEPFGSTQAETYGLHAHKFSAVEIVVGRGAHSVEGVSRLRPCVLGFLEGKGFRLESVGGDRGKGAIVVDVRDTRK